MKRQTLRLKSPNIRGKDVWDLQTLLKAKGYYTGKIDGIYGPLTKAAVESYQKAMGLKVDGIVGKKTWAALLAVPIVGIPANPTTADIQARLHEWGFAAVVGAVDGKKGRKTKAGIKQFQSCMGLKPDGIVGDKTKAALWGEIIVPRITEEELMCQCVAAGKNYCNGYPKGYGYGISVRILSERLFREVEKKHPGTIFYVPSVKTPSASGSLAGGHRCTKWNKERGGANGSKHKACLAMDIFGKRPGVKDSVIRQYIEDVAMSMNIYGGVGYGARYIVHLDNRGNKARWKYSG